MTQDDFEVAAPTLAAEVAGENLMELHGRLGRSFSRVEPFRQTAKYIAGLMSELPRPLLGHPRF